MEVITLDGEPTQWASTFVGPRFPGKPLPFGSGQNKAPLVIWTTLQNDRVVVRLEHFSPDRIPFSPFWPAFSNGGYAAADPAHLKIQSRAAFAWMFASRAVIFASDWLSLLPEGVSVKFMGFETNNPLHDDHRGHGAHWHFTLRASGDSPHKFLNKVTPHIYLLPDGSLDTSGEKSPTVFQLQFFGLKLTPHGLNISRIIQLRSLRSNLFLHVRNSLYQEGKEVSQWNNRNSIGSMWLVHQVTDNFFALCNLYSGHYLTVPTSPNPTEVLVQKSHSEDRVPSNNYLWKFTEQSGALILESAESGRFLHVRKSLQRDKHPVVQWNKKGDEGNLWTCSQLQFNGAWENISEAPVSFFIENPRFNVDGDTVQCNMGSSQPLLHTTLTFSEVDKRVHKLRVDVQKEGICDSEEISYDRLTGKHLNC
jgi:hypothetical protein